VRVAGVVDGRGFFSFFRIFFDFLRTPLPSHIYM